MAILESQAAAKEASAKSELASIRDRITNATKHVTDIGERLASLGTRALGHELMPDEKDATATVSPVPNGAVNEIGHALHELESAIEHLNARADYLMRLA